MPDWRRYAAIVVVLAAILLLPPALWLTWSALEPSPFRSTGGEELQTAERYQYQPDPACTPQELMQLSSAAEREVKRRECANQAIDRRREIDDLTQQTRAAEAVEEANWLARVNLNLAKAQFLLAIFGGLALAVSLLLTWRAITITREIGEAQVRAYLSINVREIAIEGADNSDGSNLIVKVHIEIANSGSTPAYSPIIYYDIDEAMRERIVPMADPETMQRSPLSNSFIASNGVSPNNQLSRVFQVDDPLAFLRFDRLIRFSCCVGFLDEFKAKRLTPVISGTFHHWPEGKFSFFPDNVHMSPQG